MTAELNPREAVEDLAIDAFITAIEGINVPSSTLAEAMLAKAAAGMIFHQGRPDTAKALRHLADHLDGSEAGHGN